MRHLFPAHCDAESEPPLDLRCLHRARGVRGRETNQGGTHESETDRHVVPGLLCAAPAYASWSDVTSPAELKALHANTTLDGKATNGEGLYGHFYEGGFGTMIVKGARMRAPWHLNGNHEMCIEWQEGTECFRYQRTGEFKTLYRAIRVRDGLEIQVSVERSVPEY